MQVQCPRCWTGAQHHLLTGQCAGIRTDTQIAALAGVAPLNRDSGTLHGKRMVGGERAQVQATGYNPAIKTCYQRLCGLGNAKKVALVSCMRKLVTTLKATLEHRTRWWTEQSQLA